VLLRRPDRRIAPSARGHGVHRRRHRRRSRRTERHDCGTVPDDDTVDDTAGTTPATDPAVVVPEALQFTAPLVGGGTFDGAAVAGKPTVFWFWAPT
jgi:hypothetical protein